MATTQRLGIDIVAQNKTAAAFAAVQKNVATMTRAMESFKFLMAGFVGGQFLEAMMQSFVRIARETPAVKSALDNLSASWTVFGQKVGEGGLNQGLIDFSNRMSAMITGTDGLAQSIGALMGGAVNAMGRTFEVIGRAIGFAYDNMGFFVRAGSIFLGLRLAQGVASSGLAVLRFVAALRAGSIAMGVFTVATSMGKKGLLGLSAIALASAFSLESVSEVIDQTMGKIQELMGPTYDLFRGGLEKLGFDTSALEGELKLIANEVQVFGNGASAVSKLGKGASDAGLSIRTLGGDFESLGSSAMNSLTGIGSEMQGLAGMAQQLGQTLSGAFRGWIDDAIHGTFRLGDAVRELASRITDLLIDNALAALAQWGNTSTAPGQQTMFGNLLKAFAGGFATGGRIPAGKWGVVGENGAEIASGPATITPLSKMPARGGGELTVKNTVINNTGAQVETRATRSRDGSINIETLIEDKVVDTLGGGRAARVMGARYGTRIAPRRT